VRDAASKATVAVVTPTAGPQSGPAATE
jgi:hypothetical protein